MIVWTDLETTGLDCDDQGAQPLEIAVVVTDDDLNPIREIQDIIYFDIDHFDEMGWEMHPVTREMHTKSGLFDLCREGSNISEVHRNVANWLEGYLLGETPPLGGSTISFDRSWLNRFFPRIHNQLHYRNIDVSSIKELCQRWRPDVHDFYKQSVSSEKAHRALDDIHESLREAGIYRRVLFGIGGEDQEPYVSGTGQKLMVHNRKACSYGVFPCVIHRPTTHHMRSMPTHWREDRGIMERICEHGVGHPDPDEIHLNKRHGCDGCCRVEANND